MNHLAHALLGGTDEDVVFGSLIADFLRGAIDPALPHGVRVGIALHRAVDRYTDAHPDVAAARALFPPPFRRYAGILLDIWFDHLLARDWSRHVGSTLHEFSRSMQALLAARGAELPPRMHGFVGYLRARDLPEAYAEREVIGDVLAGLSQRLRHANPLAGALPVLEGHATELDRRFAVFFPDLAQHAARERLRLVEHLPR